MYKQRSIIISAKRVQTSDHAERISALDSISSLFGEDYANHIRKKAPRAQDESITGALLLADMLKQQNIYGGKILFTSLGKPYFDTEKAHFSISHDGGLCVCALSQNIKIGIDLMRLPPRLDADGRRKFAARCFTDAEAQRLASENDLELFASFWTRREAIGKLTGEGVSAFLRKPIPQSKYRYEEFCLQGGEELGFVTLCHNGSEQTQILTLNSSLTLTKYPLEQY